MHTELKNLQAELAALTPRLASLSLYSDEGRKVAARIEYLEKRIAWLELEILRNGGQINLFEEHDDGRQIPDELQTR